MGSVSYAYDLVGTLHDGGTIDPGDRIRSYQGMSLDYPRWQPDAEGHLGGRDVHVRVERAGGVDECEAGTDTVAKYTYDGFGRRISKKTATDTVWSQWDGDHVVAERSPSGTIAIEYGFFPCLGSA